MAEDPLDNAQIHEVNLVKTPRIRILGAETGGELEMKYTKPPGGSPPSNTSGGAVPPPASTPTKNDKSESDFPIEERVAQHVNNFYLRDLFISIISDTTITGDNNVIGNHNSLCINKPTDEKNS